MCRSLLGRYVGHYTSIYRPLLGRYVVRYLSRYIDRYSVDGSVATRSIYRSVLARYIGRYSVDMSVATWSISRSICLSLIGRYVGGYPVKISAATRCDMSFATWSIYRLFVRISPFFKILPVSLCQPEYQRRLIKLRLPFSLPFLASKTNKFGLSSSFGCQAILLLLKSQQYDDLLHT